MQHGAYEERMNILSWQLASSGKQQSQLGIRTMRLHAAVAIDVARILAVLANCDDALRIIDAGIEDAELASQL
jgi:hypothetical protein